MAKKYSLILLGLLFFTITPLAAQAASLSVSPSSGTLSVGARTTVKVLVSSDKSINAISGDIIVSPSSFTIESVSKAGSVLSFWVAEPVINKTTGSIHFEGVALSGFQGTGTVLSLTLKPTAATSGKISISGTQILANDGNGTNITGPLSGGQYTITESKAVVPEVEPIILEPKPVVPVLVALANPVITSLTHPDQALWYPSSDVMLAWEIGKGVTGIKTLLDSQPGSDPQGKPEKALAGRAITNLKDGISYFHLKFMSSSGVSETAHYALRVDGLAPTDVTATLSPDEEGMLTANLSAKDEISGIDYFLVSIDNKEPERLPAQNGLASYPLPRFLALGQHTLTVAAYDRARNRTEYVTPFTVDHIPQPKLEILPEYLIVGDTMRISGSQAIAGQDAYVFVKKPNALLETYLAKADDQGRFRIGVSMNLPGTYEIWAEQSGTQTQGVQTPRSSVMVHGKALYHIFRIMQIASPFALLILIIGFVIHTRPRKK